VVAFGTLPVLPQGWEGHVLPEDPVEAGARLFALLHDLDGRGYEQIRFQEPPRGDAWLALWDRLQRASAREELR